MTIPETGKAQHNPDPYNTHVPVIGHPVHTPLNTPIGVTPRQLPQTQVWPWVTGVVDTNG